MGLSFICDFLLLDIILNSTELKGTQNIKLYNFVHTVLSVPFCPIPFCPYIILSIPLKFVRTILSATILPCHPYMPNTDVGQIPCLHHLNIVVFWPPA